MVGGAALGGFSVSKQAGCVPPPLLTAACQVTAHPKLSTPPWGCGTMGQPLMVLTHDWDLGCRAQVGDTGLQDCKVALRSTKVG